MNTMQLFELHMLNNSITSRLPLGQPAENDEICRLCGLPITNSRFHVKDLITKTFTDLEVWRRPDSFVLCRACAMTLRDGFNKGKSEGFAAVVTSKGIYSQFPWDTEKMPWFKLPEGAPNVLVFPGRKYMQKHRLFRAEACQDERYIGFWHGDIGQVFIPRNTAQIVANLETEWIATNYPTKREINNAIQQAMIDTAPDLIGHTINLIEKRRKALKER